MLDDKQRAMIDHLFEHFADPNWRRLFYESLGLHGTQVNDTVDRLLEMNSTPKQILLMGMNMGFRGGEMKTMDSFSRAIIHNPSDILEMVDIAQQLRQMMGVVTGEEPRRDEPAAEEEATFDFPAGMPQEVQDLVKGLFGGGKRLFAIRLGED